MTVTETVLPPPLHFTHSTWDIWEFNILNAAEKASGILLWLMIFTKANEIAYGTLYVILSLFVLCRYIIQAEEVLTKKILNIARMVSGFLLWSLIYAKFIEIEFGTVYFTLSLFGILYWCISIS